VCASVKTALSDALADTMQRGWQEVLVTSFPGNEYWFGIMTSLSTRPVAYNLSVFSWLGKSQYLA
jgi:hypothetical protein